MPFKESRDVYKSHDYSKTYEIRVSEEELDSLIELFNPKNIERLLGVIKVYKDIKAPKSDDKAHVRIEYYSKKVENKYDVINNLLSVSLIYRDLTEATKEKENVFIVHLNAILIAELEYSVCHDVLRKMQRIRELNEELNEELSTAYREECKEEISSTEYSIRLYERILDEVTKTIGKDGVHLIQSDMKDCALEGLNGLILHKEACM